MILQTNGQEAELLSFVPGAQTVHLETAEPMELGEALFSYHFLPLLWHCVNQ